jgi:uncharacterized protein (TIGR03437 family)
MLYTPGGAPQTWTLTIEDDLQIQGFQLTARSGEGFLEQAGSFALVSPPGSAEIRCGDGSIKRGPCPQSRPLEYVQHAARTSTTAFRFEWTPPATDVGEVRVWVAAFRAAGGRSGRQHRKVFTLRPASVPRPPPRITTNGIGEAFTGTVGVVNNGWISIYGENLARSTKTWDSSIFGAFLPRQLDGVRVFVNGRATPLFFVSPGQINALWDTTATTGNDTVVIRTDNGDSAEASVQRLILNPAFYSQRRLGDDRFYVVAVAPDGSYVGKRGTDPRVTRGARPGEVLLLFGTGFGPTNPAVTAGLVPDAPAELRTSITLTLDGRPLERFGPGFLVSPGLYQFNVRIPEDTPPGDLVLRATSIDPVSSASPVYLTIER